MPEKKSYYTEAHKRAFEKYKQKLERLYVWLPLGRKEVYKEEAERRGQSLSEFVVSSVEKEIQTSQETDNAADPDEDQLP